MCLKCCMWKPLTLWVWCSWVAVGSRLGIALYRGVDVHVIADSFTPEEEGHNVTLLKRQI